MTRRAFITLLGGAADVVVGCAHTAGSRCPVRTKEETNAEGKP
jgi:hypothetical protein